MFYGRLTVIVGRLGHQKRIRNLARQLTFLVGGKNGIEIKGS